MPKTLVIDPVEVRRTDSLQTPKIPINAYISDPVAEAAKFGT